MSRARYVLITAAHDEERYIGETLESVTRQTHPPVRWVIVSDGSIDRTDEIVRSYEARFPFISLLRLEREHKRDFACKAAAFSAGYECVKDMDYDFIGNLDGDVSFEPSYYERVLMEFERAPRLGIAGGVIFDNIKGVFRRGIASRDHTAGAVQLFRRQCFEEVGPYLPISTGGEDSVSEFMAEMKGWYSRSFPDLPVLHYRLPGTGSTSDIFRVRFREGVRDYHIAMHPLYAVARGIYTLQERPRILGSIVRLTGFFSAWVKHRKRPVPDDLVRFVRKVQMRKVFTFSWWDWRSEGYHGTRKEFPARIADIRPVGGNIPFRDSRECADLTSLAAAPAGKDECKKRYILITAARDERQYIGETLETVTKQTHPPMRWVIVSDGSTDGTDDLVCSYEARYPYIVLFRLENENRRNFACKANAFNKGYELIKGMDYDFIGNLDGDVSFEPSYYERVIGEFERNPRLGIAGGVIFDKDRSVFRRNISSVDHTAGAIQLFRRECFEEVGGYLPIKTGGVDSVAEFMAEMKGWHSRSFSDLAVFHHRRLGTGVTTDIFHVRFREGVRDYHIGMHPLYALGRAIYTLQERPWIIGSLVRLAGFLGVWLRRDKRQISDELVSFVRRKQMYKLFGLARRDWEAEASDPPRIRSPLIGINQHSAGGSDVSPDTGRCPDRTSLGVSPTGGHDGKG